MVIKFIVGIVIVFLGQTHNIYVTPDATGHTKLVDMVNGASEPIVISDTDAIDAEPSAATDDVTLAVVWKATYPGGHEQLQYAYTQNGIIWSTAPIPNTAYKAGVRDARLSVAGGGLFALRFYVNGDCRENLMYLNMNYGEPRWSLPYIGVCKLNLPIIMKGQ